MRIFPNQYAWRDGAGVSVRRKRSDAFIEEHTHEFLELVYILKGSGVHGIDGVEYQVRRGALLLINYRQVHSFRTEEGMEFIDILLDPKWISERLIEQENAFELLTLSAFSDFQKELEADYPLMLFAGEERSRLERLLLEMEEECAHPQKGQETMLKAQTNILLTLLFRKLSHGVEHGEKLALTPEFLDYIRAHCTERLSLEELAGQCFYNPSYFSRVFKEHYGLTLTEFINQSRLDCALRLLRESDLSAEEIADQAGFSSKSAFYRLLREREGVTPAQYRKKAQQI